VTTARVVIVGAGVVGAALADLLARAGVGVLVVEREFAGAGSTGAAMGHLVVMDDSPAQLALCHLSRLRWDTLRHELSADTEFTRSGTLWIAATESELEDARRKVTRFRHEGIATELLEGDEVQRVEPELAPGLAGALRVPDDMVCYPPAIARRLLDRAMAHGAKLVRGAASAIGAEGVLLDGGETLGGDAIVVAAGAHSAALLPGLPLLPRRGHLVITDRVPFTIQHQLVELGYLHTAHTLGGASVAFNIQPRRTGQLLIGSSRELVGFDPVINRPLVGRMLQRAVQFVPAVERALVMRTWVGFRPAPPDALPLIGRWPALPRTWVATGHEGLGITMAPVTAELIAADLLQQAAPLDPAPYRPDRPMPVAGGRNA
jgi:glycine/D-amino acid oxidase-like deaminating enzyme